MSRVIKVNFAGVSSELTADMIEPKEVSWLWWPRIAAGTITIIGAKGGTGKGLMLADLAARITTGDAWPLKHRDQAPRGRVLWCETEDLLAETIVPRLIAAEADLSRVALKAPKEFFALDLRRYIQTNNIRMIVLSPFNSFLQGLEDSNHGLHVRDKLENLQQAIENTNCALVGICHLNKKTDLDAIERLLGSVEYVNYARNVMLLNTEEGEPDVVRVVHAKHNISEKGKDYLFMKRNTRPDDRRGAYWGIKWSLPDSDVNEKRLYDKKSNEADSESASTWLQKHLSDGDWHDLDQIVRAGESYSHSKSALQRAQQRSNGAIESERRGFGPQQTTRWRLKK